MWVGAVLLFSLLSTGRWLLQQYPDFDVAQVDAERFIPSAGQLDEVT
jgi:hypothetical protein